MCKVNCFLKEYKVGRMFFIYILSGNIIQDGSSNILYGTIMKLCNKHYKSSMINKQWPLLTNYSTLMSGSLIHKWCTVHQVYTISEWCTPLASGVYHW